MLFDLPPPDPAFEFSVASRGMSKGIAQTEGPQVILRGMGKSGPLEFGGQWKNVTSSTARGEASAFVNANHSFGRARVTGGAAYKFQTGVSGNTDSTSFEFNAGATATFGKAALRATAIYSPDDLGSAKQSLYLEAGPSLEVVKSLRASANIGRREREQGDDYTSFNLGLSYTIEKNILVDLRYYDTAQSQLGENYEPRVVVQARVTF
jgi:uncharacterized protein (TIGR02001 family)